MSGWGWFFLIIIVIIPLSWVGYIVYRRRIAQREGFTPPSFNPLDHFNSNQNGVSRIYPASRGVVDWVKEKYHTLRTGSGQRTDDGAGAYETTGRRGRDVEEGGAWDTGFGGEGDEYGGGASASGGAGGYYEEQELGLTVPAPSHGDSVPHYGRSAEQQQQQQQRGRSKTRPETDVDTSYTGARENPFGDHAEAGESLRGVSPRPHVEAAEEGGSAPGLKSDGSPTERRSMFKEENL